MAANVETITVLASKPWGSAHLTLDAALADTITVVCATAFRVEVVNRSTTQPLYVAIGTAVADADGTVYIPASASGPPSTWTWRVDSGTTAISIVGSGNVYSVHAVAQSAW